MSSQAHQEIAPRLRGLREALELSLEDMASDLGVSAEAVRSYESGEGEIPVSYLFQVAQQYAIDLTVLISGDEAHLHNYSVVRSGRGMSVERRKDYDYKSLAYRFTGRRMEPFLVSVPPKAERDMTFHEHAGQEFVYMLEGRLEIRLGTNTEVLEAGDSLYFSSRTPHALRSLSEGMARCIDVII